MCGRSTCEVVVMADWQFLRTGNKSNNHRSLHTCLLARARQPHAVAACGAWARMSVACAVLCASSTRVAAVHATKWRARALGIRAHAVERRGGFHVQGRARVRRRGDLRHERNGASPFGRARRPAPRLRACAAGLRRTGAVCRRTEAQFTSSMAPSRSEGTARSRARGRCARPCRTHTQSCRHALGVLVCGAGTGTGTSA